MKFFEFCGNTSFWNGSMLSSATPQFTVCFLTTIPFWVPTTWLLLSMIYELLKKRKPSRGPTQFTCLSVGRTAVTIILLLLNIILFWSKWQYGFRCEKSLRPPLSLFIGIVLNIISYISIILLTYRLRHRGITCCWSVWFYWSISVVCAAILVQDGIMSKPWCIGSITSYLIFVCSLLQVLLYGLSEKRNVINYVPLLQEKPCPLDKASIFSTLVFGWYTPLVKLCFKKELCQGDLWNQYSELTAEKNIESLYEKWKTEEEFKSAKSKEQKNTVSVKSDYRITHSSGNEEAMPLIYKVNNDNKSDASGNVSLHSFIVRQFGLEWLWVSTIFLLADLLALICPILLREIIREVEKPDDVRQQWYSVVLAFLFFIIVQLIVFFYQHSEQLILRLSLKVKMTLVGFIFKKCLKRGELGRNDLAAGEILNLVSVDCQRIQESFWLSQPLLSVWFLVGIGLYELYEPIGVALIGCIIAIVLVSLSNLIFGKLRTKYFKNILALKGTRVKMIDEIMKGIKIIKVYAWEPFFTSKVASIRQREIQILKRLVKIVAAEVLSNNMSPFYMNFLVVLIFTFVSTNPYDAETAFVTLAVINVMKGPMLVIPFVLTAAVQSYVSLGRIGSFLSSDEINPNNIQQVSNSEFAIFVKNGHFKWDRENIKTTITDIDLEIKEGTLTAVVGLVGSGKSSLISSLLGEMERTDGKVQIKGSVAYVSQQAWIQNMTIKDNILYGKAYDEKRYQRVISVCCLKQDLKSLPEGDLTLVGERGVNLSGGQKQRINMARAVYSDSDIYLLDDPLSAVDAHVGKDLFYNVIGPKGILRRKTRILVTHGVHWLPYVEKILVMNDGRITETGSYKQLISHNGPFANFLKQYFAEADMSDDDDQITQVKKQIADQLNRVASDGESTNEDERRIRDIIERRKVKRKKSWSRRSSLTSERSGSLTMSFLHNSQRMEDHGRLGQDEISSIGAIKAKVLSDFIRAMKTYFMILAVLCLIASQGLQIYANFWITSWTTDGVILNTTLLDTDEYYIRKTYYLGFYGLIIACGSVTLYLFDIFLLTGYANASSTLHQNMLKSVMRCPMAFFDTTPVGRIINRFSTDIDAIDERFRRWSNFFLFMTSSLIGTIIVVVILTPMLFVVIVPVAVLYIIIIKFYLPTIRQLKRFEAVTRSPLLNHIGETISGRSIIRAYKAQDRFLNKLYQRLDENLAFSFASNTGIGWIGMRIESIGNLIVLAVALFAVLTPGLNGADVGLSMTYGFQIIVVMNSVVQSLGLLQMDVIAIERVQEYTTLESEEEWIKPRRPATDWPSKGHIQFSNYSTRYRPGLDLVLKGIFCDFKAGEKIGVVGRTGAGKSSLTMALFRLIEADGGNITIDGTNIADIGLHDLRSKIAILPQDPVLFSESLRTNVDPKGEFSDYQIWNALEYAHLKGFVKNQLRQLDTEFGECGGNLSVGQRQLVCLARTLLHKRKILILDEATAAVDMETDELIQQTIKSQFSECTVVSIAHRLNTVMEYDRILVMDQGRIVQFDKPSVLLRDKQGLFFSLAIQAGVLHPPQTP